MSAAVPDPEGESPPAARASDARELGRFARLRARLAGELGLGVIALGFAIGGVVLAFSPTPLWWFGGALLAAAATLGVRALGARLTTAHAWLRRPRTLAGRTIVPSALGLELFYVALVCAVGSVMMSEILGGERPVSHDHTVHYFKAWQLHQYLVNHQHWLGWSHNWFAGYPINYLYPPGADLFINAVYAAFLGLLSFSQAYAVGFWLFHLLTGLSLYAFGRRVGGPHVGVIAALLCLTDLSNFRMGGWAYTVEYGVWPQTLALDFSLLALCSLPGLCERRSAAALGWFGLWMGLAIITHPITLILLVLLLVAAGLAAGFAHGVQAGTALLRLLLGYGLSLLVSALFLIPFLDSRAEANQMGVWWDTSFEMGKGLLDLQALPGTLGYVLAFGMLALVFMLRSRSFALLFTAFTALCIPAVSNSTFVDELHLPAFAAAFGNVQFVRLSTMVKPFWFVLAAYCLVAVLGRARELLIARAEAEPARDNGASPARAAALSAAVALLTLPVLVPAGEAFWARHVRKSLTTESDRPLGADRIGLERWLTTQLPRDHFYRVGVFTGHNHDLFDLGTIIGRPIYKRGFTPASNFIYQPNENEPMVLDAVNLRFAISKVYMPPEQFEQLVTFGRYTVYRYRPWKHQPFTVFGGKGDVRVESFRDEEIVLRAGPGSHGKLRLNVSYFSRWHAYRDGVEVPITLTYLRAAEDNTGFMTVALQPGRYRFVFERTWGDRASGWLSLLGLALCAALIASERRGALAVRLSVLGRLLVGLDRWTDRISGPRWARARLILLCVFAGALLALGIVLATVRPALELTGLPGTKIARVRYDFLENLWRASANIEYAERNQPCLRQRDRLICRDELGNLDTERFIGSTPAEIEEYKSVRCIRARPEENAVLSVSFPRVPAGHAIVGYYGIEREGRLMYRRRPVSFQIHVDGQPLYSGETEADNRMHWFNARLDPNNRARKTVTFSVNAPNISRRYFCFYAQMVDLQ